MLLLLLRSVYLAIPGLTDLAVDWPNFYVVLLHSATVYDGKFGQIALTTEKTGTAKDKYTCTLPIIIMFLSRSTKIYLYDQCQL